MTSYTDTKTDFAPNDGSDDINITIPPDFGKIIIDMTQDILNSFPEQRNNISDDLNAMLLYSNSNTASEEYKSEECSIDDYIRARKNVYDEAIKSVFLFSKKKYPPLFFDILYQNAAMFDRETSELELLPGLNFKLIWNDNITNNTRETIWKYLQLVLFNVVSSVTDANNNAFGNSKMFESLSSDEFKSKISDTVDKMKHFFETVRETPDADATSTSKPDAQSGSDNKPRENINIDDFANPTQIHEHINKIIGGKLGSIAKEIAEESVEDFKANIGNPETVGDVFKNLMKNPTKLMSLIKNVGEKLDSKMKNGNIKESDMLAEASEMLKNMKNIPGMGDIHELMRGMGMGGASASAGDNSSGNINTTATNNRITQRLRAVKTQERMLRKLEEKRANNPKQ